MNNFKEKIFIYNWVNNPKRKTMKNRKCKLLKIGRKNSCLIEFLDNNQKEIVSRYSVRIYND